MAKTLDQYITWWNWMSMSTNAQVSSTNQLKVTYHPDRDKAVAKKWESIREGFVQYTLNVCPWSSRQYKSDLVSH